MPGGPAVGSAGPTAAALRGAAPELREKLRRRLSRCTDGGCGGGSDAGRPGRWRRTRRDDSEGCGHAQNVEASFPSPLGIQADSEEDSGAEVDLIDDDSASSCSEGDPLDYLMLEVATRMPQEDAAALLKKLQRHERRHARTKQRLREHLAAKHLSAEQRSTCSDTSTTASQNSLDSLPPCRARTQYVPMSPRVATAGGLKEAAAAATLVAGATQVDSCMPTEDVDSSEPCRSALGISCIARPPAAQCHVAAASSDKQLSLPRFAWATVVVGVLALVVNGPLGGKSGHWLPVLSAGVEDSSLPDFPKLQSMEQNSSSDWGETMARSWAADVNIHAARVGALAAEAAAHIADAAASVASSAGEASTGGHPKKSNAGHAESEVTRRARERATELAFSQAVQQQLRRATEAAAERLAAQEARQRTVAGATSVLPVAASAEVAKGTAKSRMVLRERVQALEEAEARQLPKDHD